MKKSPSCQMKVTFFVCESNAIYNWNVATKVVLSFIYSEKQVLYFVNNLS